jgi:hypothetical protein
MKGMLSAYQYSGLPDNLPSDGLMKSEPENPVLGVWLMPDNSSEGMAESFAVSFVPDEDATLAHATLTVTELPIAAKRFATRHNDKALLHTWLAWQEEPGCQTGAAILRNLLDVSRPLAVAFVAWIERWLKAGSARSRPT